MTHTRMRPIRSTISLDEARALIDNCLTPIARTERVGIDRANARVVATPVVAQTDVPPFVRAAMDGYAVRAADTFGASSMEPRVLSCVETVYTGHVPARPVETRQCSEIATGAPIPAGADAVVMVEETDKGPTEEVHIFGPVYPGQNVTRQGADIKIGASVLAPGDVLNPSRIGALAALGFIDIEVFAEPRVAILSTGNEVVEPGTPLRPGHIYDVNKFTLGAVLREHGAVPVPQPTAPDTIADLRGAIEACLMEDVVLFSGGSSVGERDLILDVVEQMGEVLFHGIAVKPGKPTLFGVIGGKPVFGMPGYPTSCLSNAYMLWCRRCAAWHTCHRPRPARCGCRWANALCQPPAGTSSTPFACWTARPCPPSRHPATSRACRRQMATSRSSRRPTSSRRVNWST
ncbi:MAG: molybdenum cofactor synthesis domain-containing protein [Acidobacteriota bacterium]